MSGDYSRDTFDPWRDFSAVLMQQGRVQLDADWNELVAILERRIRAGTFDMVGQAVVPGTTPDAFKIRVVDGDLQIGVGRIYVDGILAENHGGSPVVFDAHLAEPAGTTPLSYGSQPAANFPNPPALPESSGPHLVYLDVWQREVTAAERPELVEPAVAVDTTTRLQTVWQVKVLVGANLACETNPNDIPGWVAQNPPAAGRLSVTTRDVGEPAPCVVPPSAGFRGLENQLYRVEVHDDGTSGGAVTFKWSRDNGSVVTRVSRINASRDQLVVESLGRDDMLGFKEGDWVEVTDDWLELHNRPGQLRRIKPAAGIDQATRTLILEKPLDAGLFPTDAQERTAPERNTRIRRWDQRGLVIDGEGNDYCDLDDAASTGAIPLPSSGAVHLEDGIVVSLKLDSTISAGRFRSGDYWVFAARSGEGTVEVLTDAPPAGIHHHYAKLAIVGFPNDDGRRDCRTIWPPRGEGCCLRVAVGDDVQNAVDRVIRAGGGCICLAAGVHEVSGPLLVVQATALSIHGEGPATVLRLRDVDENGLGGIVISKSSNVMLEGLTIVGEAVPATVWALSLLPGGRNANASLTLRDLAIVNVTPASGDATRTAVRLGQATDVRIERCRLIGEIALTALFSDQLPYPWQLASGAGPDYGGGVRRLCMIDTTLRFVSVGVRALGAEGWQIEGCDMRPVGSDDLEALLAFLQEPQNNAALVEGLTRRIDALVATTPTLDQGTAISAFRWRECTVRNCQLYGARGLDIWWWFRGAVLDTSISAGQDGVRAFWLHDVRLSGNRLTCLAGRAVVSVGSFRARIENNRIRARVGITHATWNEELARLLEYVVQVAAAYGATPAVPSDGQPGSLMAPELRVFWMLLRESLGLMKMADLVDVALAVLAPNPDERDLMYYTLAAYLYQYLRGYEDPVSWLQPHLAPTICNNDVEAEVGCVILEQLMPLGGLTVTHNRLHSATGQSLRVEASPLVANVNLTFLIWRFGADWFANHLVPLWKEQAAGDPAKEAWIPFADLLVEKIGAAVAASESICAADHRIESNQLLSAATAIHSNLWQLAIRNNRVTMRQQPVSRTEGGLIVGALLGSSLTSAVGHAMRDGEPRVLRRRLGELAGEALESPAKRAGAAQAFGAIASGARHPKVRSAADRLAVESAFADRVAMAEALEEFAEVTIPYWNSFGIIAGNPTCRIEDNEVAMPPDIDAETWSRGGILVTTDQGDGATSSELAILVGLFGAGDEYSAVGITETLVAGNSVVGGFGHGVHVYAPITLEQYRMGLTDLKVRDNEIRGMGGAGLSIDAETQSIGADVANNRIFDCSARIELAPLTNGKGGIRIGNAALCRIRGNQVVRCGRGAKVEGAFAIDVESCYGLEVDDNDLLYNGADRTTLEAGGLRLSDVYGQVAVRNNKILFQQGVGLLWNNSSDEDGEVALPQDLLFGTALYLRWEQASEDMSASAIGQDARRARATISGNQWQGKDGAEVPAFSLLRIGDLAFSSNTGTSTADSTGIGKISFVRRCTLGQNNFTCSAPETLALCSIDAGVVSGNVTSTAIGLYFSPGVEAGLNVPAVIRY